MSVIYQCIYDLLTCCHNVKKIAVPLRFEHLKLVQESRYLAIIKAIDPDIIEFLEVRL
jgi:hypothetical protein